MTYEDKNGRTRKDRRGTNPGPWQRVKNLIADHVAEYTAIVVTCLAITSYFIASETSSNALEGAYDTRKAQQESCFVGNSARLGQVADYISDARNYRSDAKNLMNQADLYHDVGVGAGPASALLIQAENDARAGAEEKLLAAHRKDRRARNLVESVQATALDPESPNFLQRAVRDCEGVYPLPDNRGDVLP